MLVLSRVEGESLVIGDGETMVEVTVVRMGNGKVRLGVTAPTSIAVHRKEVYERVKAGAPGEPVRSLAGQPRTGAWGGSVAKRAAGATP